MLYTKAEEDWEHCANGNPFKKKESFTFHLKIKVPQPDRRAERKTIKAV